MGEYTANNPERNEIPELKKEMQPGEKVHGLVQNAENPLVEASKVKELTGVDSPATMAIEIGKGQERRRLLVVPVERGVKLEQGIKFDADFLLLDPNLIEFDEQGPISGFGLKGLKRDERVAFTGDSRRVDEKLDLTPGRDPSFMISVSRTGSLDIMVHPNSPAEINLIFPDKAKDVAKKETPVAPPVPEASGSQEVSAPVVPPETLEQRLAPVAETEHTEELTADDIFASPETFMATLNRKDLGRATRIELLHIMGASEKQLSVQHITDMWESGFGESLSELSPSAQAALAETYPLDGMFNELESMSRRSLNYPEEMPQHLNMIGQLAEQMAAILGQTEQSDAFREKAADFMRNDDRQTKVRTVLQEPLIVDDAAKIEDLVVAHVPGERLDTMRQRLEHELKEEPGLKEWPARKEVMATLSQLSQQEPHVLTNQQCANRIRHFLNQLYQAPEEALREFVNLGIMGDLGHKIRSTLQHAQSVAAATT